MPPVKHTNKQPVPAPPVLQTIAQDSQIKNKIGRIDGLNVALAILKDEI